MISQSPLTNLTKTLTMKKFSIFFMHKGTHYFDTTKHFSKKSCNFAVKIC